MTKDTYDTSKIRIQKDAEEKLNSLTRDYCRSNNPYKVGDIIEDHFHIIKITSISGIYMACGYPSYNFIGIELKKDLTPKERQDSPYMFQGNVKRKLN